jgi:hypothetical protein
VALSIFVGTATPPDPASLKAALGKSADLWTRIVAAVGEAHGPIVEHWHCASAKGGWAMRLKHKDRVVLYLIPQSGAFLVGVVLGEKAVKAAHEQQLPPKILAMIDAAPRYAEGRGIRFAVSTRAGVAAVVRLAAIKMAT